MRSGRRVSGVCCARRPCTRRIAAHKNERKGAPVARSDDAMVPAQPRSAAWLACGVLQGPAAARWLGALVSPGTQPERPKPSVWVCLFVPPLIGSATAFAGSLPS